MNLIQKARDLFFTTHHPLPAGMYHYESPPDAANPYRMHLRLEPDGNGLLILNASTVLHLNQTAAEFAYYLVKQTPEDEALNEITRRYRITKEVADKDYHELIDRIQILITTPDLDPETFLDFNRNDLYSVEISAPYRLDCALTYKCYGEDSEKVAPVERVKRELSAEEWKTMLKKSWDAGIPHIIFTGGEPTLRPDLAELIAYTQDIGQVTGLLTNGLRLAETQYLHELLQSGLDHLMLLLDPEDEQSWEALRDVLAEDIFTTVHLTVTQKNAPQVTALIERLAGMGVTSLSLSVEDQSLKDQMNAARQAAAHLGVNLVWDLPVPYSSFHPVALELAEAEAAPAGAGKAWLYVEPDGDVTPTQGNTKVLGNLLSDPWEKIWQNR
jgi:organic radical activating enzyme